MMLDSLNGRPTFVWPLLPVSTVLLFIIPFLLAWPG